MGTARAAPTCLLCGGSAAAPMFEDAGRIFLRCPGCGLEFVASPPDDLVGLFYGQESYFRKRQGTVDLEFGYHDYLLEKYLHTALYNFRLDEIEELEPPGRLLDVGCAAGFFLEIARLRGWKVKGAEISPWASRIAREYYNLDIACGTLQDARFPDASFDVVLMDDVLEHVPRPLELLQETCRVLRPGGLLTLRTPNAAGWWRHLLGRRWFHYKQREHLVFFTPRTLARMLEAAGFTPLSTYSSSRMVDLRYIALRLRYYMPPLSAFLSALARRRAFYSLMRTTFFLKTGEMVCYARR